MYGPSLNAEDCRGGDRKVLLRLKGHLESSVRPHLVHLAETLCKRCPLLKAVTFYDLGRLTQAPLLNSGVAAAAFHLVAGFRLPLWCTSCSCFCCRCSRCGYGAPVCLSSVAGPIPPTRSFLVKMRCSSQCLADDIELQVGCGAFCVSAACPSFNST